MEFKYQTNSTASVAARSPWLDVLSWPDHALQDRGEANEIVYRGLPMLSQQVQARDPEAVRLAFTLLDVLDGAALEDVHIMLGKLIRIDPEMFLREVSPREVSDSQFDGLVGNFGGEYVDLMEAVCLEAELRIQALRGVTEPTIRVAQERSVNELTKGFAWCN